MSNENGEKLGSPNDGHDTETWIDAKGEASDRRYVMRRGFTVPSTKDKAGNHDYKHPGRKGFVTIHINLGGLSCNITDRLTLRQMAITDPMRDDIFAMLDQDEPELVMKYGDVTDDMYKARERKARGLKVTSENAESVIDQLMGVMTDDQKLAFLEKMGTE